jgi:hypothetical protein
LPAYGVCLDLEAWKTAVNIQFSDELKTQEGLLIKKHITSFAAEREKFLEKIADLENEIKEQKKKNEEVKRVIEDDEEIYAKFVQQTQTEMTALNNEMEKRKLKYEAVCFFLFFSFN